eukprot:TRINITY_DN17427_c0_g1_i1.p1 TRINITY_DN17427_c0_g1~~TRINITY_DN17427_c0_g1_i1.p1  ORF type:complete len:310 (+),score=28.48 TRINITY_DN17427_c0_g1_i1:122-1051(+)
MEIEAFLGAPVSKGILLGCIVGSSVTRMMMAPISLESIGAGEVAKLTGSWWCYTSMGDLVLGSILVLALKNIEKWCGSRKFASYILISGSLSMIVHLLIFKVLGVQSYRHVRPGPISLIFTLLVKYFIEVPSSSLFSEKVMVYACALLYCQTASALPQATSGVIGGLLTISTVLPFKDFRIPKVISNAVWAIGKYLETKPSVKATPGEIMAHLHGQGPQDGPYQEQLLPGHNEVWGGIRRRRPVHDPELEHALNESLAMTQPEAQPQPSFTGASLTSLTDMGFDAASARQALTQAHGSVEHAIQILTGG